jgi:hypothetical protein
LADAAEAGLLAEAAESAEVEVIETLDLGGEDPTAS